MTATTLVNSANVEVGTNANPLITSPASGAATQHVAIDSQTANLALETGGNLAGLNGKIATANADGVFTTTQLVALGASDTTVIKPLRVAIGDGNDGTHLLSLLPYFFDSVAGEYFRFKGNNGALLISDGGTNTTPIASGTAGNTVVKNSAGRLCRILVTAQNTNAMSIFDNASTNSGTIIGIVPANATVGTSVVAQNPAVNGITVGGNANNPGVTISWM